MRQTQPSYRFGDIVVDPGAFCVERSGSVLSLEPKSIRLLLYLIENRARAISKDELLRQVWEDVAVTDNALTRLVAQLRKALGDDVKVARYIETIPTIGYRFIAEVAEINGLEERPAQLPASPPAAPARRRYGIWA